MYDINCLLCEAQYNSDDTGNTAISIDRLHNNDSLTNNNHTCIIINIVKYTLWVNTKKL